METTTVPRRGGVAEQQTDEQLWHWRWTETKKLSPPSTGVGRGLCTGSLRMSGSPQVAEEVTQDVFVFLLQRVAGSIRNEGSWRLSLWRR